jgi:hypothetical protein
MSTLTIRSPDGKHERLKALAKSNDISVNKLMDESGRSRWLTTTPVCASKPVWHAAQSGGVRQLEAEAKKLHAVSREQPTADRLVDEQATEVPALRLEARAARSK